MEAAASEGVLVRLRGLLPSLAPAERRVAEAVLTDPAEACRQSITQLARRCETSETTVVRFCRTAGFGGYPQLRLSLAAEAGRRTASDPPPGSDIESGDDLASVVAKIAFTDARAIEDTAEHLDLHALAAVVEAIASAERIELFGVGASGVVTADLEQKLRRIGRVAFASADAHGAMTSAALIGHGDVAIGVTHSGATRDTVDPLWEAKRHGATTVAITNFPRSAVAEVADHVLVTAARESAFRSGAMASRLAQLVVVDCLFVAVAQRALTETQDALQATLRSVHGRRYGEPETS